MTQSVSSGGAPPADRPMFFVSHAGPTDPEAGREDDELFKRFFVDLSRAVADRLTLREHVGLGYLVDATRSARETARALAVCRVFVPLWSPLYFTTERCGQEWSVFLDHVHTAGGGSPGRYFAPVTWAPVSAATLPRAAREVDRGSDREERPDAVNGLYTLMPEAAEEETGRPEADTDDEELYRMVVNGVAEAVVRASSRALRPTTPARLEQAPNAFTQRSPSLSLRVAVLAPTTRVLPEGRIGHGRYGEEPLDWAPYGNRPLAEDVTTVIERLGYELHLVAFDDVSEQLLADSATVEPEPTLLLIDNWSLLDEERRRQVASYVRLGRPWCTFMVVRDPADPETRERMDRLRAVVDETLSARLARMRIDLQHAASGDGIREGFTRDFSMLAQVAESSFIRR
jgi:FxsC-like protein